MTKIAFEITDREISRLSRQKLNKAQVKKILGMVENDSVLWDNIETAIQDAIEQVLKKA